MSNLLLRTISGIVFVTLFLGSIWWNEYSMFAISTLVLVLGLFEFKRMFKLKDPYLFALFIAAGVTTMILSYLFFSGQTGFTTLFLLAAGYLVVFTLYYLFFRGTTILETGRFLFNFFWITTALVLFMALGWINNPSAYQPSYMIILLSMIWVYDAGAYLFGSWIGRHMLAPVLSPGKTIEGFVSGILLNSITGTIAFVVTGEYSALTWIAISVAVSLACTAGDLFESKMKREAGVKDSGKVIPGHGGILDRFDSLYFSTPVFFIIIQILQSP